MNRKAEARALLPTLVLMAGLPGSGKTTLALAIGRSQGWPVIDKDTLKSPLLTLGVSNEIAGPASYELLFEIARDLLVYQHLSVILDSPAGYLIVLEKARTIASQAAAHLKIIMCTASSELRSQRITTRFIRPSQWDTNIHINEERERQLFAHLPPDILLLDTAHSLEHCLSLALDYLSQ